MQSAYLLQSPGKSFPPNQWNSDSPMGLDDESQQGADGLSPVTVKVNTELPRIQTSSAGMNQEPCGRENE